MAGAILLALLVGFAAGLFVGRRNPAGGATRVTPASARAAVVAPSPSRQARKAGLSDADFVPSDDILEKLRKAAEGELDPSELRATEPGDEPGEAAVRLPDPELTEAERRVLERLRQLQRGE